MPNVVSGKGDDFETELIMVSVVKELILVAGLIHSTRVHVFLELSPFAGVLAPVIFV